MKKIFVPEQFSPTINCVYPPNNVNEFERWLCENFKGCNTEREYLPVFWTGYYVNNNYGNDQPALDALQEFLDALDPNKKYWTVVQYDDGILNDIAGLDILQFHMSKNIGQPIPLLSEPHPYKFNGGKKYECNFVGSPTHPLREHARRMVNRENYFISFDRQPIERYCEVMSQSLFTLCFRGYGANSFRVVEAMQYGSIPVIVSDEFIIPWKVDFNEFGVLIKAEDADKIEDILYAIPADEIAEKQDKIPFYYEHYYTYEANLKLIIKYLENERQNLL